MNKVTLIFLALLLSGCADNRIFEENQIIDNNTWKAYQAYSFSFSVLDTTRTYNLLCNIRNTSKYPNYNIYIRYVLMDSAGNKLETELKNFILFDPKSGDPYGKTGLGDLFEHQNPLITDYEFPYSGSYSLSMEQLMRYENLPEINFVGLRVELTK